MTKKILTVIAFLVTFSISVIAQEQSNKSIQLYPVRVNGKAGYIDRNGNIVIKPQFNRAWEFVGDLALVEITKRYRGDERVMAYINTQGKLNIVEGASTYSEGVAIVGSPENGIKVIDTIGKVVIKLPEEVSWTNRKFSDGMATIQLKNCIPYDTCGKLGFVNRLGQVVIEPKFRMAEDFHEGLAAVTIGNDEWFFIDKTGKEITKQRFHGLWGVTTDFSEGLAGVKIGDKWGYINKTGEIVIPPQFEGAKKFSEGLAAVQVGCLWGYVDKTGTFIIKPQFRYALEFSEGLAPIDPYQPNSIPCPLAGSHDKLGYIDQYLRQMIFENLK